MTSVFATRVISAGMNSNRLGSLLAVLIIAFSFPACSTPDKPKTESAPSVIAHTEEAAPANKVPPPENSDVASAVRRVFKDSAEIDASRKPTFIDGDFNGDGSRDLAVVIRPVPNKLADLNEEFPSWILKDPLSGDVPHVPRLRVAGDDVLLAVIHGYGANGWRDPEATQTFLLKNAVGSGMTVYQAKDVTKENKAKKRPYLRGDVIAQTVDRTPGYLYFAGATYSWYDPRTFDSASETGMAHLRRKKLR
jgi:hypothetical protein